MLKVWSYFDNPFLNCTKKSFKKAIKISTYTDSQLYSRRLDAFYGPLYTAYHPLHLLLVAAYNTWKAQNNVQISSTFTITQLIKQLSSTKIEAWSLQIQGVYPKKTAPFIVLLAHGHKPYQKGTRLERIGAVAQLKENLTGIAALAATEADVTAFLALLETANSAQSGNKGNKITNSSTISTALLNAMNGMYSILGSCITQYNANPTLSSAIFDMATIRSQQQSVYTGAIKPLLDATVAERTFLPTDSIDFTNHGTGPLGLYLAAQNNQAPTIYTVIEIAAGIIMTIDISMFTGNTGNNFLSVVNLSATLVGHYEIDLG